MATLDDVREIVAALPEVTETTAGHGGGAAWRTKGGLFVWERGPRHTDLAALRELGREWPDCVVVGLRTDGLQAKEMLLRSLPGILFTIPHFDGYPAVLCRLDDTDRTQLAELVTDAWLVKAPKRAAKEWLAAHGLDE